MISTASKVQRPSVAKAIKAFIPEKGNDQKDLLISEMKDCIGPRSRQAQTGRQLILAFINI